MNRLSLKSCELQIAAQARIDGSMSLLAYDMVAREFLDLYSKHFLDHDAVPMTKAEIIYRREEVIRMSCSMIIYDEWSAVSREMWDRWQAIDADLVGEGMR